MCSSCNSPSPSGRASPEDIDTFWDWYPQHIQMQFDEQLPSITSPFPSDPLANSDITSSSQSSFNELEICIHELLQVHCSNREVPLLFEIASQPDYEELLEFSREQVIDAEDPFLLDLKSARDSEEPLDRVGLPDNLLAMPTPTNPQQNAVRKWLEYAIPLSPISTPLTSPEPILDANLSSFLLSPTLVCTQRSPSNTSGDSESETSSTPSSEYESHQPGRSNYSEDSASNSYFGQPTHVTRHQPRRDSVDDHLESLDQAECGAVVTASQQPESRMSYRTALEWQEPETRYFSGITQGQLDASLPCPFPNTQARFEREKVNEPFLPCFIWFDEDEGEDEDNLYLEEREWGGEVQVSH